MKSIRIILLAMALIMTASPAFAVSLGVAGDYNAFVFGSFSGQHSDVQGRLAAGGSVSLTEGYSVGSNLAAGTTGDTLIAGGALSYDSGNVYQGDVRVGGAAAGGFDVLNGTLYTGSASSINFVAQKAYYQNLSTTLSQMSATGTTDYKDWGSIYLSTTDTGSTQVFTIDGDKLMATTELYLDATNITADTTIIINVTGSLTGETIGLTNMGMQSLEAYADNIIFNFFDADEITLAGVAIWGTVLAPDTAVTGESGNLNGTLIANSFDGGMEFHSTPTPIPGSIALLGTGLAGLLGWRRRRR